MKTTDETIERVRERILALIRDRDRLPASVLDDEIEQLGHAVCVLVGTRIDIPALESKLRDEAEIDLPTLQECWRRLDQSAERPNLVRRDGSAIATWEGLVAKFKAIIDSFSPHGHLFSVLERVLRLDWGASMPIHNVLAILPAKNDIREWVATTIARKLGATPSSELLSLWGQFSSEFRSANAETTFMPSPQLEYVPGIIDDGYFALESQSQLPERVSDYLVRVRPRVEAELYKRGQDSFPTPPVGVARLLAIRDDAKSVPVQPAERELAIQLAELVRLMENLSRDAKKRIADELKIDVSSRLLSGTLTNEMEFPNTEKKRPANRGEIQSALLFVCEKTVSSLGAFREATRPTHTPVLRALKEFKLSKEVRYPRSRGELVQLDELEIQKEICAHLILRGIPCFGTKFGQNESDVVGIDDVDPTNSLVIEVKIYRDAPPSPLELERNFVQLLSYMNQSPVKVYGSLVVINFSDCVIDVTVDLLDGRIHPVSVNLMESASHRRHALIIGEGAPGRLVGITEVGRVSVRPGKKSENKAATRPRRRKRS